METKQYQNDLQKRLGGAIDVISVYDEIDSSNTEAMRFLENDDTRSRLIVARSQTAGRGRRGRQWSSPLDSGLYMSLSRALACKAESIAGLSLVTALAVWQALNEAGAREISLKWPNDVLHNDSKLGGILLESRHLPDGIAVVFGIGINLNFSAQEQTAIDRKLANLSEFVAAPISNPELVCTITRHLLRAIDCFLAQGFKPFQQPWNEADQYLDAEVVVTNGVSEVIGRHCGVDRDGALLIETATGRQRISGGEVFPSLRKSREELV